MADSIVPRALLYLQDASTGQPTPATTSMFTAGGGADFSGTNNRLDTTNTALGSLGTKTDATNTKLDLLATYQDGLETAAAATNTALGTLTAKFPTALGQLTKTGSLSVVMASDAAGQAAATPAFHRITDGTSNVAVKAASTIPAVADPALVVAVSPNSAPGVYRATGALTNGTVTTGGSVQAGIASNTNRRYLLLQNNSSADLWFNLNGTAAVNAGFKVAASSAYEYPPHFIPTGAVSVFGATTGQAYAIVEA